jgi:hypothetical protein
MFLVQRWMFTFSIAESSLLIRAFADTGSSLPPQFHFLPTHKPRRYLEVHSTNRE